MEGIVIDFLIVDALVDVDFPTIRPIGDIGCPECGPSGANPENGLDLMTIKEKRREGNRYEPGTKSNSAMMRTLLKVSVDVRRTLFRGDEPLVQ